MAEKNYIKYIGAHPHVDVGEVGAFTRDWPEGPFTANEVKLLTKKAKEFVALTADEAAAERLQAEERKATPAAAPEVGAGDAGQQPSGGDGAHDHDDEDQ
jgi:hypothetical protein